MNISNLIQELKRRNVFKVAVAYGIAGWLIIQISDTVFPRLGLPDWTITFIIALVAIGFPIAIIFAWAFELTPEGLKKSREVEITESVTNSTGKKLNGLIISVLSIALFFVVIERIFFAKASFLESVGETEIVEASIAVLPFVNMSSDTENEYFSDGLSEELLNALAKVEDMQVAGRTSSFKFKGQNENLTAIGAELGVENILEGSVRKSGDRLRITAQLIRVSDGFHMWSETYDRELTANNIFDIQEEISRHVLEELKIRLLPEEEVQLAERPTEDIEAYNAFLEATQLKYSLKVEDIEKAIQKYKEAIRLDPSFSEAYAGVALQYYYLHFQGNLPLEETKDLMKRNLDQALLMNGNSEEAYFSLAQYYSLINDKSNAEIASKRALDLSPNNAEAIDLHSLIIEDNEEKERLLEKAYRLDPINPRIANRYADVILMMRDDNFKDALKVIDGIIERNPEYTNAYSNKAFILRDSPYGELDQAFEFLHKGWERDPKNIVFMYSLSDVARDVELFTYAEYLTEKMRKMYPDNSNWLLEQFRNSSSQGNYAKALEFLNQLIEIYQGDDEQFGQSGIASIEFQLGKFEVAANRYKEWFPEYLESDFNVVQSNVARALEMAAILKKAGDTESANRLIDKSCEFTQATLDNLPDGEEPYSKLFDHIKCLAVSDRLEEAAKNIEILHFEQNSKANWPSILRNEAYFYDLYNAPEFAEVKAKMFDDLHSMKAQIIEFLKAEGEWKKEWEEN